MNNLLYIKASPRGADSKSSALADAYLAALRERLPDLSVDTLDLSRESIPDFDGDKVAAKMAAHAPDDAGLAQLPPAVALGLTAPTFKRIALDAHTELRMLQSALG